MEPKCKWLWNKQQGVFLTTCDNEVDKGWEYPFCGYCGGYVDKVYPSDELIIRKNWEDVYKENGEYVVSREMVHPKYLFRAIFTEGFAGIMFKSPIEGVKLTIFSPDLHMGYHPEKGFCNITTDGAIPAIPDKVLFITTEKRESKC